MYVVGDVHGNFEEYERLVSKVSDETIQLGDFGIGFPRASGLTNHITEKKNFFIRGNHDNPDLCKTHPNYLGDFGVYKGVFYVSGAFSIDRGIETSGIRWWTDEELSFEQCYKAVELYEKEKPKIVVSHECPTSVLSLMRSYQIKSKTNQLLESLFQINAPDHWYFGHHHNSYEFNIKGTQFHGLNVMEILKI